MAVAIAYPVSFNSWLFTSVPNLQVYAVDPYALGTRTLNMAALSRVSARKVSSAFYDSRQINISLYITASSRLTLDQALNTLYTNIQSVEGLLAIPQANSMKNYTATYSGQPKINQIAGGFIDLTLTFECSDNFGYDQTSASIVNSTGWTTSPVAINFTQNGTADTQTPFIQVTYTAVTGGTAGTVLIGNQNTGQTLSITRTYQVNDILQIDCNALTVTVNGLSVPFTGAFPVFGLGPQIMTISDNFTTRTFNPYTYVYNRYI